jgi:hypothetical protein
MQEDGQREQARQVHLAHHLNADGIVLLVEDQPLRLTILFGCLPNQVFHDCVRDNNLIEGNHFISPLFN